MKSPRSSHRYLFYVLASCLFNIILIGVVYRSHISFSPLYQATGSYDKTGSRSSQPTPSTQQHSIIPTIPVPSNTTVKNGSPLGLGLSPTECRATFSSLFDGIDSAIARRANKGSITASDIDISWKSNGAARVLLFNNKACHRIVYVYSTSITDSLTCDLTNSSSY